MITVQVDDSRLRLRLSSMASRVQANLVKETWTLVIQLATRVRQKLSGEVLQVRTGNLRASIHEDVKQDAHSVTGRVASSGDVKYASSHEFGATINIPEIVPVKARALYWESGGADVFAMRARAHTIILPERSFLRSSLVEMKQQIIDGLTQAVVEGMKG